MKANLIFIPILLMTLSCVKFPPQNESKKEVEKPSALSTFDWKTIEIQKVSAPYTFSVLNQDGDTIASNLEAGDYNLYVGKGSSLNVVKSDTESVSGVITKADITLSPGNSAIYFPAQNKYATVMFEDLFPFPGDRDMNDIVFGLNIVYELNKKSELAAIHFSIEPRAIGSTYDNIGVAAYFSGKDAQLYNISRSSSTLSTITTDHSDISNLFTIDPKVGYFLPDPAENGANKVIPFTGNFRSLFINNPASNFFNVYNFGTFVEAHNFTVKILFKKPLVKYADITFLEETIATKVNISIFATFGVRSKEVHFKYQTPSQLFDTTLYKVTGRRDFSSSEDNWVWAILSDKSVRHPIEMAKINNAYPQFNNWLTDQDFTNWYGVKILDSLYTNWDFNYID